MRVLVWSTGQDTGGQGVRIRQAFARYAPDWVVDTRNGAPSKLGYPEPAPLPLKERRADVTRLYNFCDVVHLRNHLAGWVDMDKGQGKPVVLHHHGTHFRNLHGSIAHQSREIGATQVAATLDLTLLEPDVEWVPSPYDIDALVRQRRSVDDGVLRVAYFPTAGPIKSAGPFMTAFTALRRTHNVELLSNIRGGRPQHMPWQEVMAQKARADVYFDQVILGYGNNAIEAWGMGIPVIAGVEDPKVRALMIERFGRLPFLEATESTIYDALRKLVESKAMREEYAALGMEHVRCFHDQAVVVPMLQRIYRDARPTQPRRVRAVTTPRAWVERRERREAHRAKMDRQRSLREALRQGMSA